KIRITDVHAKADPARNAVDRAGKHFAYTDGCNRVKRSAGACCALNRQNQLGGRAKSIATVGHQNSPGVSASALDQDTKTRRGRDFRDNAERSLLALQQRSLFDVQFDECFVVATWQLHPFKIASESSSTADLIERDAIVVRQLSRRLRRKRARQQPASKTSDSKTRGLFGGKNDQLNRMPRTKSALLQTSYRFQPSHHPYNTVEFPGVRNGVNMRAGAYNRRGRISTHP